MVHRRLAVRRSARFGGTWQNYFRVAKNDRSKSCDRPEISFEDKPDTRVWRRIRNAGFISISLWPAVTGARVQKGTTTTVARQNSVAP